MISAVETMDDDAALMQAAFHNVMRDFMPHGMAVSAFSCIAQGSLCYDTAAAAEAERREHLSDGYEDHEGSAWAGPLPRYENLVCSGEQSEGDD